MFPELRSKSRRHSAAGPPPSLRADTSTKKMLFKTKLGQLELRFRFRFRFRFSTLKYISSPNKIQAHHLSFMGVYYEIFEST